MSLTYATYIQALRQIGKIDANDNAILGLLPRVIEYAEGRIYRESDLLTTVTTDTSATLTANSRKLPLPTAVHFVTIQKANVITPPGTTNPELGKRNPLTPMTQDFLDNLYGDNTVVGVPVYMATVTDQNFIVGPWADYPYTVEFIGTIQPTPLSDTNTTTYLTNYLPDLFLAASMVFLAGYQRDYGAQSDDPQMALSWEQIYLKAFASSNWVEQRKRWAAGAWSAYGQASAATQERGQPMAAA